MPALGERRVQNKAHQMINYNLIIFILTRYRLNNIVGTIDEVIIGTGEVLWVKYVLRCKATQSICNVFTVVFTRFVKLEPQSIVCIIPTRSMSENDNLNVAQGNLAFSNDEERHT